MPILSIFLFVSFVFAQSMSFNKETGQTIPNFIGEVKLIKGNVFKIISNGSKSQLSMGVKIYKNDTLTSEEKSFAKISMIDETVINLAPNSEVNFEKFEYQSKTNRNSLYSLIRGQISADVKNKANSDEDIVVKTKNAVLAVRGTKLLVNYQDLKNFEISEIGLKTGLGVVKNLLNTTNSELTPLRKIIVAKNKQTGEVVAEEKEFTESEKNLLTNEDEFLPFTSMNDPQFQTRPNASDSSLKQETEMKKIEETPSGSFENLRKLNEKLRNSK